MSHPHSGTARSGSLLGPNQPSLFNRTFTEKNQENTALFLSGGATNNLFLSGFSKIAGGIQGLERAKSASNQAELLRFDAKSEEIKGEANAAAAIERLNDVQASNIVASFASGVRLQGSTAVVQQVVSSQADFSAALSKANAALVAGGLRREASVAEDFARRLKTRAKFNIAFGAIMSVAAFA